MCIFAYGQTGSGKTHTMAGSDFDDGNGRGINFRALDDLFAINEQRRGEVEVPLTSPGPTSCGAEFPASLRNALKTRSTELPGQVRYQRLGRARGKWSTPCTG